MTDDDDDDDDDDDMLFIDTLVHCDKHMIHADGGKMHN